MVVKRKMRVNQLDVSIVRISYPLAHEVWVQFLARCVHSLGPFLAKSAKKLDNLRQVGTDWRERKHDMMIALDLEMVRSKADPCC